MSRIVSGIEEGGLYKGSLMPVLSVDMPLYDVSEGGGLRVWELIHVWRCGYLECRCTCTEG